MSERNKLAVLGGFFVLWGLGIIGIGTLITYPGAGRVVIGGGILFGILGCTILLVYAFGDRTDKIGGGD